ncbi:MAG TPA: sugar ABC transporter permease [Caldilineae bacterium]|nr:sugar ABC transporter permease [Caldilineae bacterium]
MLKLPIRIGLQRKRQIWAYIFLLIPMAFFLFIRLAPTLFAFNMSLRDWNPLSPEQPFVGLKNFAKIVTELENPKSVTRKAFQNTFLYVILGVPSQLVLSLAIALMLNHIRRLIGLFRAVYFLPFVTSTVAIAWVWRWMYQPQFGPLNVWLDLLGLPQQPFLRSPQQALPAITAVAVWHGMGFAIIIFLAGLKQIPEVYYEAARIDGAGRWALFRHITIPLLNPTIVYLTVLQTISFLRMFTEVLNMTRQGDGGPLNSTTTVVLRVYREGFGSLNMGFAAALTVVLFAIILMITIIQLRFLTRRFEY